MLAVMSSYATERPSGAATAPPTTGWIGIIVFGGIMLMVAGAFQVIEGLTALFRDEVLLVTSEDLLIDLSYTAWGWIHLIFGLLAIAAGAGVFAGWLWARIAGVAVVFVATLVHAMFLPAAPVWCTILIVMDIAIIYALCAHGRDVRAG
ncbi:hypothetical protein SAMN05421748_113169 [Paractinoplanes atraurantiacus]|uniref:DUF7144 domain-containing protein n=2 Tax=Paractinoplanes atraurantiacus TaxID=1036182 RepID=A0A285IYM2_9ACTN|nr:hypothetical protein SAMN05421748_113169 [Actinoplanes atraurantiacus]